MSNCPPQDPAPLPSTLQLMQFMCWLSLLDATPTFPPPTGFVCVCVCRVLAMSSLSICMLPGICIGIELHFALPGLAFSRRRRSLEGSLLVCVCLSTASCRTSLPASFVCQRLRLCLPLPLPQPLYLLFSCICVFVYLTIKVLASSRFECVNCCSPKQLSLPIPLSLSLSLYLALLSS